MTAEQIAYVLITTMLTVGGIAVGKLLGSHGKQSLKGCESIRTACVETVNVKLDNIIERLRRIESHVLNGKE